MFQLQYIKTLPKNYWKGHIFLYMLLQAYNLLNKDNKYLVKD